MNSQKVIDILNEIRKVIDENKLYLTELDAKIGDGDHGLNLSKGFNAVCDKINGNDDKSISEILKMSGMALVSSVGGASGPLYGTAFMKASMSVVDKEEIDINDFVNMLDDALEGIKMRGKSAIGEKTMIDSIEPALISLKNSLNNGLSKIESLEKMVEQSLAGVEKTKDIVATKGRASYLGERSLNHQDAGATSSYLILKTIYNCIKEEE